MGCTLAASLCSSHQVLLIKYSSNHEAIPVQQITSFPAIGRALSPPHAWGDFPERNGPFYILNYQITGLGTDLARWCTRSELYLTQGGVPRSQAPALSNSGKKEDRPFGREWPLASTTCTIALMKESRKTSFKCSLTFRNMLQQIWIRTSSTC